MQKVFVTGANGSIGGTGRCARARMDTIVVSGAAGFIGRNRVDVLVRRGARVRAMLRDLSRARRFLPNERIHNIGRF